MTSKEKRDRYEAEIDACVKQSGVSRDDVKKAFTSYPRTAEALRVAGRALVDEHGFSPEQVGVVMTVMAPVLNACCADHQAGLDTISNMLGRIVDTTRTP